MATENYGDYSGYTTPGGIRFRKNNKLVSAATVPAPVVEVITRRLTGVDRGAVAPSGDAPKFAPPTEEQKRQLREDSLHVPESLQRPETMPDSLEEPALNEADFDVPAMPTEPFARQEAITEATAPSAEQMHDVSQALTPPSLGIVNTNPVDADFLESVSIYSAPIESLVQALYDRFGVYTVYLGTMPNPDEINPLTGERFTKYHLGIAYQAAIRAVNQGILDRPAEEGRLAIDKGREASANYQNSFLPQPTTFGEARTQNSFAYRTSVRGMNETQEGSGQPQRHDKDEDEMIVEPRMGIPVVRPNW